ncbi:MAG: uroporphyrinogen-III C-methyltransferase [Gammaproteobacteria bacterium]|nr:uroporphyrinogen-III C-methyltransferase [Gammaproteobacteria bacterium]MBU3989240.1 uroporphyrinogen-III C-methyltransferase [Gammaproteobacteria bacterium]MBU4005060.1 uroporphyrinogen-III C-methyltransferase [Gammaproteobacteria bacterium]MBU4020653.1 uroporphyrinogen-III C-methyltransferase [Gammaproteobacteria bacterium]MBU4095729.1 uroporphyrinogen-III C-methyltransferase [Gammaproteobacteria bacterium]
MADSEKNAAETAALLSQQAPKPSQPSEQPEPQQPDETNPTSAAGSPRQPAAKLAIGLAVFALLASSGLGWLAWQGNQRLEATRQELSRRLADTDAVQREATAGTKQDRAALDALQAKVGALDARAAEMQSQQLALETMYQEFSRVREDRLLAEIEQEVAIAAQQLQLAGNVEAALIALQGAEARLAKSAQAQFLPLRKLLNRDIERLKALPGADVPGIALKLNEIIEAVPNLPLAYEQRPAAAEPEKPATAAKSPTSPPPPATAKSAKPPATTTPPATPEATASVVEQIKTFDWQAMGKAWLAELWGEVRQLVRIERIDRPDPGLLSPRESLFLRENLRLRLLSARLGLLARDGSSFQSDLKQADEWLERYFDNRAPAVVEAQATLKNLAKQDVMRKPIELNETLAALRNFKLSRDRGDRGTSR